MVEVKLGHALGTIPAAVILVTVKVFPILLIVGDGRARTSVVEEEADDVVVVVAAAAANAMEAASRVRLDLLVLGVRGMMIYFHTLWTVIAIVNYEL